MIAEMHILYIALCIYYTCTLYLVSDVLPITIDKYKEVFQKASQEVAMHICTSHGHYMFLNER